MYIQQYLLSGVLNKQIIMYSHAKICINTRCAKQSTDTYLMVWLICLNKLHLAVKRKIKQITWLTFCNISYYNHDWNVTGMCLFTN